MFNSSLLGIEHVKYQNFHVLFFIISILLISHITFLTINLAELHLVWQKYSLCFPKIKKFRTLKQSRKICVICTYLFFYYTISYFMFVETLFCTLVSLTAYKWNLYKFDILNFWIETNLTDLIDYLHFFLYNDVR